MRKKKSARATAPSGSAGSRSPLPGAAKRNIGNLVFFDELIGKRRLCFYAVVSQVWPSRCLVWQMKWHVMLPAWLSLEFQETAEGLQITHTLSAGFSRIGCFLDPLIRLFLSPRFERDLAAHARTEFKKLADLLQARPGKSRL